MTTPAMSLGRIPDVEFDATQLAFRFLLGAALLAAVAYWAGPSLGTLRGIDAGSLVAATACSLLAFGLWFEGFYQAARTAVPTAARRTLVGPYLGYTVARLVAPAGTLSGVAVGGFLTGRRTGVAAERTVGAVAVFEVLSMLSSSLVVLSALGGTMVVSGGTGLGAAEPLVAGVVAVTLFGILSLIFLGGVVTRIAVFAATVARRPISVVRPSAAAHFERSVVRGHVDRLSSSVRTAATDRRAAASVLTMTSLGWVAAGGALYFVCVGVDLGISLALAVVAVPISGIAGLLPTPGGLGGVEALLAGVLIAAADAPTGPAIAATVVFRLITLWLHLAMGVMGSVLRPIR